LATPDSFSFLPRGRVNEELQKWRVNSPKNAGGTDLHRAHRVEEKYLFAGLDEIRKAGIIADGPKALKS
jgi:hypothetical protein